MKIPDEAKCVFKGVIFDVYQWQQKMYDGSFSTFERLKMSDVVQIIPVTVSNKILISYEEQPTKPLGYTFFGGHQERGEDPLSAARRELLEETGFKSDDFTLYGEYEQLPIADSTMSLYIARNCKKVKEPSLDPGEKIEVCEVSFDEFMNILKRNNFINKILAQKIIKLENKPDIFNQFKEQLFNK